MPNFSIRIGFVTNSSPAETDMPEGDLEYSYCRLFPSKEQATNWAEAQQKEHLGLHSGWRAGKIIINKKV